MRTVAPGELRHRLVYERQARTADGTGGVALAWTPVAEIWASIEPLSGKEKVVAEGLSETATHVITIRYRPGVAPGARFRLGTRLFRICSALDIGEQHRFIEAHCEERGL